MTGRQRMLGDALARGVGTGGRASGRTLRHIAHLLDIAAAGAVIVHVAPTRGQAQRCFDMARDLAPEDDTVTVMMHTRTIETGAGILSFSHLEGRPVSGNAWRNVVMDHAVDHAEAIRAGWDLVSDE